jgi:hypothetical protein
MSIEIRIGKNKAEFLISTDNLQRINKWKASINAKVYEQQIKSGKLVEHKLPKHIIKSMKRRNEESGEKIPYYGSIGIDYIYKVRVTDASSLLEVTNSITKDSLGIVNPSAEKKKGKKTIMFFLSSKETKRMIEWKSRENGQGEENDYLYEFCPTDIGCFSIIRNLKTGYQIGLTDIESL